MKRVHYRTFVAFVTMGLLTSSASAQLTSPQVGWQTELSTLGHNVSGTVTIIDDNTLRIDDFVYDGGGPQVYFYLGTEQTDAAFTSGLEIGPRLDNTSFDGTQGPLLIDLPVGETLEGYQAISVWCVRGEADFGSGTFAPIPEPTSVCLIALALVCFFSRRNTKQTTPVFFSR